MLQLLAPLFLAAALTTMMIVAAILA